MNALLAQTDRRRGFTMTELIVVIGVIAVLAGILLAAMGGVRRKALSTTTQSTMTEFSKACDAFQLEHGRYPGAVPENAMADQTVGAIPPISSTENALLDLMGGSRVMGPTAAAPADWTDFDTGNAGVIEETLNTSLGSWVIRADINRMGEGPLVYNKSFSPYFTPSDSQVGPVRGQVTTGGGVVHCGQLEGGSFDPCLPDLLDAWGQPIIFIRRARPSGPLVGSDTGAAGPQPQFYTQGMMPYTQSPGLGEIGANQETESILNTAADPEATFAQILRHPSLGSFGDAAATQAGTAQGSYILISAGPDGIYFSRNDGPGTPQEPIIDLFAGSNPEDYTNPAIVKEYDDIRIFGGG